MTDYDSFIAGKLKTVRAAGFDARESLFSDMLFDWQKLIVRWAVKRGRCAIFADCGLGKTPMQLEWAKQIVAHTGGAVLILCPLAVAEQTVREGAKFGIQVFHAREADEIRNGINITNYDRLEKFDPGRFAGVVLDESSILKNFTGKLRQRLTEAFAMTPFRLCCTATPAPNDWTELSQQAHFLGVCSRDEMLATYFINDTFDTGTWRLKGHAEESFWRWISSWAVCLSKPSDIGFSDDGYILPPVQEHLVEVAVDHAADAGSGELFRNPHVSATALHKENRRTLAERVEAAASIVNASKDYFVVWCATNDESTALRKAIPDSIEVIGSQDAETKERLLEQFGKGEARVVVTKASMAGLGLNWQHCCQEIYVGMNHSFERFYQAGKRIHRFGQKRTVHRYIVKTDLEDNVLATVERKAEQHEHMQQLVKFAAEALTEEKAFIMMNTEIVSDHGEEWTLYHGDCVRVAWELAPESIGFSIFSPPFADLFTYSSDIQDMGNCGNLDDFMRQFTYLIQELFRVTMPGRECAVHCCDLLSTKWKDGSIGFKDFSSEISRAFRDLGWLLHSKITIWKSPVTEMQRTKAHGLLYKTLRADSSDSRVGAPDYLLVFRKPGENPKPITHTESELPLERWQELASPVWWTVDQGRVLNAAIAREDRDERHICPLQLDVIERALLLWSAPRDLVFSPFAGIGSEGYSAIKMGRKFIGSELKESYWKTACDNLRIAESERIDLFTAV